MGTFMMIEDKVKQKYLTLQSKLMEEKWIRKPLLILVILYLVALSAVFRANYNYIDDSGRTVAGYRGWNNWSRYVSNILSIFIFSTTSFTTKATLFGSNMLVHSNGIIN